MRTRHEIIQCDLCKKTSRVDLTLGGEPKPGDEMRRYWRRIEVRNVFDGGLSFSRDLCDPCWQKFDIYMGNELGK